MELGITSLSSLLNDSLTHVIGRNKLTSLLGRKVRTRTMIALNKLSHTLNSHNLTPDLTDTIIQSQDSSPNKPPESRRINSTAYVSSPVHTCSRINSNPLFEAQDMDSENPLFHIQDYPSSNDQTHTEAHDTQEKRTRKRHHDVINPALKDRQKRNKKRSLRQPRGRVH
eukprot:230215-Pelagomonas_calceolata.AAC.1